MSLFREAELLFLSNRYEKAKLYYERAIHEEPLSNFEKLKSLERVISISEKLNQTIDVNKKINLLKLFIELKENEKSKELIQELFKTCELSCFIDIAISFYKEIGRIKEAKECISLKAKNLYDKKIFSKLSILLDEEENFFNKKEVENYKLYILNETGNYNNISELKKFRNKNHAINILSQKGSYWLKKVEGVEVVLSLFEEVDFKNFTETEKRLFINATIDFFLSSEAFKFDLIANYSIVFRNKGLAKSILPFFSEKKLINLAGKYNGEIDTTVTEENELSEYDEIIILERNYKLLNRNPIKNAEKLNEISKKIKEIDPLNTLLSNKNDSHSSNEIYESLTNEFEKYNKENRGDNSTSRITAKHLLQIPNYKEKRNDIISNLIFEEDYNVCLHFIDLCEDINDDFEKKISLAYSKAEVLYLKNDFYDLKDYLDDLFEKWPLLKEEKVQFFYLYAESLAGTNHKTEAIECFHYIEKNHPDYRLTNLRLSELEEN
ncbi:hypothetical protein OAT67_00260 [Bacteriovoracaceae bacterium]|nr:hypothetical protein [Bacteriovoracaceae bacterium]